MKTKPLPPLPPELRRAINKRAHSLALVAEIAIRDRLTAQAYDAAQSDSSPDAMLVALGLRALTDAELDEMAMTDAQMLAWFDAHAIELTDLQGV